jgi:hypothetical protein
MGCTTGITASLSVLAKALSYSGCGYGSTLYVGTRYSVAAVNADRFAGRGPHDDAPLQVVSLQSSVK